MNPSQENRNLLLVTSMAGAANCAASLGHQLSFTVEAAGTRREALAALRGREYAAIVIDDSIAESDPVGAELLHKYAGGAVVLEVNFAISGVARLARAVRSELQRREREKGRAMRLAFTAIESDLRSTVTGLLLHSQLALDQAAASPRLSTQLHQMLLLAGDLRQRLERPSGGVA